MTLINREKKNNNKRIRDDAQFYFNTVVGARFTQFHSIGLSVSSVGVVAKLDMDVLIQIKLRYNVLLQSICAFYSQH